LTRSITVWSGPQTADQSIFVYLDCDNYDFTAEHDLFELRREQRSDVRNSFDGFPTLNSLSHIQLRLQVLSLDGWRCQAYGTMSNLEVHHQQFRSHSGHDTEENLITLCTECHAGTHQRCNH
jgi:HNH endonuclease